MKDIYSHKTYKVDHARMHAKNMYRQISKQSSVILLLRLTIWFVLQANEEADLLGGRGDGETVVLSLLLVGGGGGGGLGLRDLPVAAVEIQGGESRWMVHLDDGLTLTLQVQRRCTQAFSQTVVTKIEKRKKEKKYKTLNMYQIDTVPAQIAYLGYFCPKYIWLIKLVISKYFVYPQFLKIFYTFTGKYL